MAAFIPKSITRVAFSLLSGILLGANCVAPYLAARDTVSTLIGSTAVLAGTVAASPKSKNGSLRIILKNPSVNYSTSALKCQIYLSLIDGDINIEAGDVIEIKGKLNDGFGSYAVSVYRANLLRISKPDPPNYFA